MTPEEFDYEAHLSAEEAEEADYWREFDANEDACDWKSSLPPAPEEDDEREGDELEEEKYLDDRDRARAVADELQHHPSLEGLVFA